MAPLFRSPPPTLNALSVLLKALAVCQRSTPSQHPPPPVAATRPAEAPDIAWHEGDVEEAPEEAKKIGKPLLLYWGAIWCTPCNWLKGHHI